MQTTDHPVLKALSESETLASNLRGLAEELEAYGFTDDRLYFIAHDMSTLADKLASMSI